MDYKGLECHCAASGLNSVGDGESWRGFNQASGVIPPVPGKDAFDCSKDCGRRETGGLQAGKEVATMMPESEGNHEMGWGERRQKLGQKRICENLEPSFALSCFTSQFPPPWKLTGEPEVRKGLILAPR